VGTQQGDAHQCVPFCAAQAWAPLGAAKLAEVVRREESHGTVAHAGR
jgi:hypothetical protein